MSEAAQVCPRWAAGRCMGSPGGSPARQQPTPGRDGGGSGLFLGGGVTAVSRGRGAIQPQPGRSGVLGGPSAPRWEGHPLCQPRPRRVVSLEAARSPNPASTVTGRRSLGLASSPPPSLSSERTPDRPPDGPALFGGPRSSGVCWGTPCLSDLSGVPGLGLPTPPGVSGLSSPPCSDDRIPDAAGAPAA